MEVASPSSSRRRNSPGSSAVVASSVAGYRFVTVATLYLPPAGLLSALVRRRTVTGTRAYHPSRARCRRTTTVTLPPGPATPRAVQAAYALTVARRGVRQMRERYGDAFTVNVPIFGRALVISDPAEIRQLFLAGPDDVDNLASNLGRVLGPGSLFALAGEAHHRQRKLLVPPFHGRRLAAYEKVVEDETVRELASWPHGRPFATLPSMMRITLNVILRAVFGAEG